MRPLIAGNWKMHGTALQLGEIAAIAAAVRTAPAAADILICPPSTLIARAVQAAAGQIAIGGRNCAAEISGAFTGDLSAEMLKDAGAAASRQRAQRVRRSDRGQRTRRSYRGRECHWL